MRRLSPSTTIRTRSTSGTAVDSGVGRFAVATGTTCLLVVRLDVFGQVEMNNESHVGPVDPHAECIRSRHDLDLGRQLHRTYLHSGRHAVRTHSCLLHAGENIYNTIGPAAAPSGVNA